MLTTESMTRADRIFRELEFEIVSGKLSMGTKLGEETLAARFGVSRGPLREALRRLEGGGLVVRLPHLGVRVVQLSTMDLAEIYEIREVLEGLAARLAAERMTEEERAALKTLLQEHLDLANHEGTIYPQAFGDEDIHYRIAKGAKSYLLKRLLCGDLYSLIRLCRYRTTGPDQVPAYRDHIRIIEAIAEGDGQMAEILMRRHIVAARHRLVQTENEPPGTALGSKVPAMLRDLREMVETMQKPSDI
ncbi:GntR family transcriptional regulator [Ancylobacter sp. A5.8]|uniref:GntR family transcriptional regulator n=1 Tax=Ancylobacter gelatini TaxID=2919920 RepID=UPI001F4E10DD|nr:GntR family transcriptional regulator [Ancylobacter gelatini]MCJ8144011.1 GntR family transcriptional regulator [Ancylobacter gelatini]